MSETQSRGHKRKLAENTGTSPSRELPVVEAEVRQDRKCESLFCMQEALLLHV